MIKYLGSKRALVPVIAQVIEAVPDVRHVVDAFSGTARVGHALKRRGVRVTANDSAAYAATLARCYVEADAERFTDDARMLLAELARLPGRPGYFTHTFCEQSRFVHPKNGERVDAIRESIAKMDLDKALESVLLTSLMEAADRVDSTCGVQMAYLKQWASRAHNDLELRLPDVLPAARGGAGRAVCGEAAVVVDSVEADVVYLDPPYNQHSYLGNYHVWESLVRWDKPETYGVACKRVDVREKKSPFNSKKLALQALAEVVRAAHARVLIVSFSDEGHVARADIEALLGERGAVSTIALDFKRYVGAQIGIYNPHGEKTGSVSHLRNVEYLFVVDIAGTGVDWESLAVSLSTAEG